MLKRIVRSRTAAAGARLLATAMLLAAMWAPAAEAARNISACGVLDVFGETYNLTTDISAGAGDCLVVANNRIRINLKGHEIVGSGSGSGITDAGIGRDRTIVTGAPPAGSPPSTPSGGVFGFATGINLWASTRNDIREVESSENVGDGIWAGKQSLVRACLARANGGNGIVVGDFGQVQDCVVGDALTPPAQQASGANGIDGIVGGQHALITRNVVATNGGTGISVGELSTVSFNTASANGFSGILAGGRSLITGNAAHDNGEICTSSCEGASGIETADFSTVSKNAANGNADEGIDVKGINATVTGNTTNDNGDVGLEVECPSTVTTNNSSGNGSQNYQFEGNRCALKNNT